MPFGKLGIVGGMGPYATALFFAKLTSLTQAESDKEHIECIIHSVPQIPDRTAFITGKSSDSPAGMIIDICRSLESQVSLIAIPCVTSHHFYDEISASVSVPVADMHKICADVLLSKGASSAGIIATQGTVVSGRLEQIISDSGIKVIKPACQDTVSALIYDIKAGKPAAPEIYADIVCDLAGQGAQYILLACSELQVYASITPAVLYEERMLESLSSMQMLDASELLAGYCISALGRQCKQAL